MSKRIAVTTGNNLEGYEIEEYLGVVWGIVMRNPTITEYLRGSFNNKVYEEVCTRARSEACSRMVEHAQELGADAVIAMRYDATEVDKYATEILAYGTAVKLRQPTATAVQTHLNAIKLSRT
jgi:uncharacterized protein YbjQ (UPF0145 family)